jgi:hypothetical protein
VTLLADNPARLTLVGVFGASLWLATWNAALAGDVAPAPPARVAAADFGGATMPERRAGGLDSEEVRLLAQNSPTDAWRAPGTEDTILARFPLSAPKAVEEEVARTYDLELVDRSTLHALELRIARYRVFNPARLEVVLERMQFDQRIASAQLNVRYVPHPPPAVDSEVGVASKPNDGVPRAAQGDKSSASRVVASVARRTERNGLASANARPPQRSGEVADLLVGGL